MGNKNGGIKARIGSKFLKSLDEIKDKRFKILGKKGFISTEKITNLITHHKYWKEIGEEIVKAPEEDINKYGK